MLKKVVITKMKKTEQSMFGWYFLFIVGITYIAISLFKFTEVLISLNFALKIIIKLIPFLISIFVLMAIINYFVSNKILIKWLGEDAGIKGWFLAVIAGIISIGPIYMWYPFLSDLQEKNVKNKFIATFLYNRAVKPALIPLLILYFGIVYTIVLSIVMIFASILQGILVDKILEVKK